MAKILISLIYLVIFSTCLFSSAKGLVVSSSLNVTLNHGGILIGRHLSSSNGRCVRGFLGIPYAEPPVGELRFSAPVAAKPWVGERMAITDGNVCSQVDVFFNVNQYSGVEDCLYLNVYVPEEPKTKGPLPVMVWIHGGGFVFGTGMMSFYDPKLLMDRDIVLVSFNYRLATLGFLSSETLDMPGNFGLKDQLLALQWVQEHISAFGGDPKNVTIFGESAGSGSVSYLTYSQKTRGLFHRAIAQSGTFFSRWGTPAPKGYAADLSRKIAGVVGCGNKTDSWPTTLKCLRTVSDKSLQEAANQFLVWRNLPAPIVPLVLEPEHEQAFITKNPTLTAQGNDVPMMVGYNSNEGLFFYALQKRLSIDELNDAYQNFASVLLDYPTISEKNFTDIKALVDGFYFKNGTIDYKNFTDMLTDAWFFNGIDKFIQERVSAVPKAAPLYYYNFDNKGFSVTYFGNDEYLGTCHFDDLFYLFPLNDFLLPTMVPSKQDHELRETMLDLWYNFAAYGNPTPENSKLTKWEPLTSYPPTLMRIGSQNEGEPLMNVTSEYPLSRTKFWDDIEKKYFAN